MTEPAAPRVDHYTGLLPVLPVGAPAAARHELTPLHYINLANGRFSSTTRSELKAMFDNYRTAADGGGPLPPLVVHFHGGLVDKKAGMETAARLLPEYLTAGGYPAFFVWESGLWEVISRNLPEIFRESIFARLMRRVVQFAVGKANESEEVRGLALALPDDLVVRDELRKAEDGLEPYADVEGRLSGASDVSDEQAAQFEQMLRDDPIIEAEVDAIANGARGEVARRAEFDGMRGVRTHASTHTLMSPDVVDEIRADGVGERGLASTARVVKGAVKILRRVVKRGRTGRGHGLHATVVEEILREFYIANAGGLVWSQMKKDTQDAFGQQDDCGGAAFVAELAAILKAGQRPRVVLVGHSTGAIYICEFLVHANAVLQQVEGDTPLKFDIVLLAPACTFHLLAETVAKARPRIENLRIFAMSDAFERKDQLIRVEKHPKVDPILRVVYPHSLLYFVSGVTEEEPDMPLVGMQRFYSGTAPYSGANAPGVDEARDYIKSIIDGSIWSVIDGECGRTCDSERHGDFDNTPGTLKSIRCIIEHGYARH